MNDDFYSIIMAIAGFLDFLLVVAVVSFAVYKTMTKIISFYFKEKNKYNN